MRRLLPISLSVSGVRHGARLERRPTSFVPCGVPPVVRPVAKGTSGPARGTTAAVSALLAMGAVLGCGGLGSGQLHGPTASEGGAGTAEGAGGEFVDSAGEILARTAMTYATCRTYRDRGWVEFAAADGEESALEYRWFSTAFVRGEHFRFEHRYRFGREGRWYRHIIHWPPPSGVRTWSDAEPKIAAEASIDSAVGRLTGVTAAAAHSIPRLLLPDRISGNSFGELVSARRLPDGSIRGAQCYRIRGMLGGWAPVDVWIDGDRFLILRIVDFDEHAGVSKKQITTFIPEVNVRIPPEDLRFARVDVGEAWRALHW